MRKHALKLGDIAGGMVLEQILDRLIRDIELYSGAPSTDYNFNSVYSDHLTAIQYALVSRQWMQYLRPYFLRIIYIASLPSEAPQTIKSRILHKFSSQIPQKRWKSNIKSVISIGGTHFVKRLYIFNHNNDATPTLNVLLQGSGFGKTAWTNLREIILHKDLEFQTNLGEKEHIDLVHSYLSTFAPSLSSIYSIPHPVFNALDNRLSKQRLHLDTQSGRHLTSTYFPHLTTLSINDKMGLSSHHLITFFAPTLRNLLIGIRFESLLSWRQFIDSDANTIEFDELRTLDVSFIMRPGQPLPSPRLSTFYGQQTLLFPKLHTLKTRHIFNAHVDFKDLFANVKLGLLEINEWPMSLPSINSMPLANTDKVSIDLSYLFEAGSSSLWIDTPARLFGSYSNARTAELTIPLLPSAKLDWPNLIRLDLAVSILDWNSLEVILPGLLHLRALTVSNVFRHRLGGEAMLFRSEIKSYTPTSTSPISPVLEEFMYQDFLKKPDANASSFIQQLILRSPRLMVVRAQRKYLRSGLKLSKKQGIKFELL
ncbi:hypothetical protein DL89DRAFT_264021 [Linderina pennispora]|uniref:F-box domain-containing protein n=1 Tax=Linderina pennispora TaxID=61395 RepID=A0A1Y1WKB2_9FUNG|nr:uncharacterized protein DL89DRAFT_264021 [Linderina pennispora]ORX74030.1 hypothetical protein DL89DRAFT_264021 [Linderina pennispora]